MTLTHRGKIVALAAALTISAASMVGIVTLLIWIGLHTNTGGFVALGLVGATVALIAWKVLRLPETAPMERGYSAHDEEANVARAKRHV